MMRTKQQGVGLLELMMVLVVAAIIAVMSVNYYSSTSLNQKVSSSVSMIRDIFSALQSVSKAPTFTLGSKDDISDLIDAKLLSSQFEKNPFNGAFTSKTKAVNSLPVAEITLSSVPSKACVRIQGQLLQTMSKGSKSCGSANSECVECKDKKLTVRYELF